MTFTIPMKCCRVWPIVPGSPVGRCGYCDQRPYPTPDTQRNQP